VAGTTCIVQEGQIPEATRTELAAGLERIGREMFGDQPEAGAIAWLTIREGFGFTAGRPSTTSLIVRTVPAGLADELRATFLSRVSELWRDATGCTMNEIVVTAMDATR
jgi:hypothetical protein